MLRGWGNSAISLSIFHDNISNIKDNANKDENKSKAHHKSSIRNCIKKQNSAKNDTLTQNAPKNRNDAYAAEKS